MTINARPIRFTAHLDRWKTIATLLDGELLTEDDGWVLVALPSGRLALHHSDSRTDAHPPGSTQLGFETNDLTALAERATAVGVDARLVDEAHGQCVRVNAADGVGVVVDPVESPTPPAARGGSAVGTLSVMPIWYTPSTDTARTTLGALGLVERITSEDGGWTDFACPAGGLAAVHHLDEALVDLSFEYSGDLDALAGRLTGSGIEATVVDENYSRVIRFADPDGGADLWINAVQEDLYGYRRTGGE